LVGLLVKSFDLAIYVVLFAYVTIQKKKALVFCLFACL